MDPYTKTSFESAFWQQSCNYYQFSTNVGENSFSANYTGMLQLRQNTLNGYRNPLYKQQIRNATGATTHADGIRFKATVNPVHYGCNLLYVNPLNPAFRNVVRGATQASYNVWPFTDVTPAPAGVVTRATNRCIAKFIDAVKDVQTSVEAGQDFGEYKETMHTIHRPFDSIRNLTLDYLLNSKKLLRKHDGKKLLKALSDSYLEYRFGVLPLALDISDVIAKWNFKHFASQPVTVGQKVPFLADVGVYQLSVLGDALDVMAVKQSYNDIAYYIVRYKGAVKTRIGTTGLGDAAQKLRLLPRDWAPTLWDLLPYSWMADYFTNIGEIINAMAFSWWDVAWGQTTNITSRVRTYNDAKQTGKFTFDPSRIPLIENYYVRVGLPTVYEVRRFTRDRMLPSDLIPTWVLQVPLSARPWENMAALCVSRFSLTSLKKLLPDFPKWKDFNTYTE